MKESIILTSLLIVSIICATKSEHFPNCPVQKGEEGNSETLVSVQIINRVGCRAPIFDYPNDRHLNFDYGVESGELTPTGKEHSFLLGRCFRQSYYHDNILQGNYTPEKLFCQSADVARSMMTADLVLAGLFPPQTTDPNSQFNISDINWQPIPCTTIDSIIDNKLAYSVPCPAYLAAYKNYKLTDPKAKKFITKYESLYAFLTIVTGQPVNDFDDVYQLYDTITFQHYQLNLDYPSWFKDHLAAITRNNNFFFFASAATTQLQKLISGPFLNELINNFNSITGEMNDDKSPSNRKAKMYLYSGWDTTIAPLAETIGVYDWDAPPYFNSAISLELHKSQDQDGEFIIRIFYKEGYDQPMVEKFMAKCPAPCTFTQFKELVKDIVVNDLEWGQICNE